MSTRHSVVFGHECATTKYFLVAGIVLAVLTEAVAGTILSFGRADIIGDTHAAIVSLDLTQVIGGDLVKVMSWYDNEWGFTHQMVRMARQIARQGQ